MKRMQLLLCAMILVGLARVTPAMERMIQEQNARKLVENTLPALGEDPKLMDIRPWRYYWAPEFYSFEAYRGGSKGVLIIYYISVNPWTGDVWDATACKRITTPAVKKEQDLIWQES